MFCHDPFVRISPVLIRLIWPSFFPVPSSHSQNGSLEQTCMIRPIVLCFSFQ